MNRIGVPLSRWLGEDRGKFLFAISAGWFLSMGIRLVYPVLLPYIRAEFSLDFGAAGLLLGVLWAAYAVGQVPAGILTDRLGERSVLAGSTAVAAGMLALVVFATDVLVLYGTTVLFGLATALFGVARYTAVARVFPERDGAAIGVTLAAGSLGNVVLPAAAGVLAAAYTWRLGIGLSIPLLSVVAVYLWVVVPQATSGDPPEDTRSVGTVREVLPELLDRGVIVVTAMLIVSFAVFQAFTGFFPSYLIETKGVDPTVATGFFSLYFSLGIVVQPLSGAVYDRFGIRRSLPVILGLAVVAMAMLPVTEGLWPLAGLTVLLSSMMSTLAMVMPYLTTVLPNHIQATGLGIVRTTYILTGSLSPPVFGLLADAGLFDVGFVVLAGLLSVIVLLSALVPDARARQPDPST